MPPTPKTLQMLCIAKLQTTKNILHYILKGLSEKPKNKQTHTQKKIVFFFKWLALVQNTSQGHYCIPICSLPVLYVAFFLEAMLHNFQCESRFLLSCNTTSPRILCCALSIVLPPNSSVSACPLFPPSC